MAYRWLGVLALLAVGSIGCENSESGDARGTGGVGGDDGSQIPCVTSTLCLACPSGPQCDTSQDCAAGFACIESGCDDLDGAPINQCVFAGGGACESDAECSSDRKCIEVPGEEVMRCVKTTPGCDADSDCVLGFSCEESSCVDRRVPCILDADCPKSHFCHRFDATGFCRRMHQSCDNEFDCAGIAPRCDNVDGDVDGTTECAGTFNPNAVPPQACLNSMCSGATPVCEVGEDSGFTDCGQYGLCRDAADCADGFECVALWLDGRSECVPVGGSCSHITDCPARQVCASPRDGGAPECQAGYQPL
jgi:hypothetical protein